MNTNTYIAAVCVALMCTVGSASADDRPTDSFAVVAAIVSSVTSSTDSSSTLLQADQSKDSRSLAQRTGVIASTVSSELPTSGNSMTAIFRMLGALCAVLALMWVVVMVAKKYLRGKSTLSGAAKRMVVEETLWLGPKKQVVLLSVGSRHLVVGVTDETMTTLSEIASDELTAHASSVAADAKALSKQGTEASHSFDRLLTQAGGRLQHLLRRTAPTQ